MEKAHKHYLIGEQVIGSGIINFILGVGIAYALFRGMDVVPMWGHKSIGGDILATSFLLTMILCLIVTPLTHKKISSGHLPKLAWRRTSHPLLSKLPAKTFPRSIVLGIVYMAVIGLLAIGILHLLGIQQMVFSFWSFVFFKASFAALVAALSAPVIALCAMGDA